MVQRKKGLLLPSHTLFSGAQMVWRPWACYMLLWEAACASICIKIVWKLVLLKSNLFVRFFLKNTQHSDTLTSSSGHAMQGGKKALAIIYSDLEFRIKSCCSLYSQQEENASNLKEIRRQPSNFTASLPKLFKSEQKFCLVLKTMEHLTSLRGVTPL